MDNCIAVMAIDPGGSTGIVTGIFDKNARTVEEAMAGVFVPQQWTITGTPRSQSLALGRRWRQFYRHCVFQLGISPADVHCVVEDFTLASHSGTRARAGEDPLISVKVAWGFWGYRFGQLAEWERNGNGPAGPVAIHFQLPGQALGFATDKRLKTYKRHRSGKPHENAAWKHVAYFLSQHMKRSSYARTRVRTRSSR